MKIIFSFFYCYLLVFSLISCQQENYPVAGIDPIREVTIVEDHSELLVEWMKKGYKDMTLVHVDHHDDLRYIPDYKVRQLKKLYKEKKWLEILENRDRVNGLYSVADFIYPAYKLGIIKKIYWIPTSELFWSEKLEKHKAEESKDEFIKSWEYYDEIVDAFKIKGRTIKGKIYGLDIIISSINALPEIEEPVLLSIDVDYFSDIIKDSKSSELVVIKDFFIALQKKKLKVKGLDVIYSTNGGFTPITDRHLCEEIVYCFEYPGMIHDTYLPEIWKVRDKGFYMIRHEKIKAARDFFIDSLNEFQNEPSLLLGRAITLALTEVEMASHALPSLIQTNPEYDYVYLYLKKAFEKKNNHQMSQLYFQEYYKRNPDYYRWLYNNQN